jgi:2-phosphosulfolactate phosphatase
MFKPNIQVCFSPHSYPLFQGQNQVVVVVDVLRATSAICAGIANGVNSIMPVETVEEAKSYSQKGFIVAGERNGEVLDGFELGNSPFSFMDSKLIGKNIALTTTNGTKAITSAYQAECIIIGAFVNLNSVTEYLLNLKKNVLVVCAGWKDKFNLEDTLFAGAVANELLHSGTFVTSCDSARASMVLYDHAKDNLENFLKDSSHRERLGKLNLEKDIEFCLSINKLNVLPILDKNGFIVKETQQNNVLL